jgi:formylmethanofuran dehydrogenase subunit E
MLGCRLLSIDDPKTPAAKKNLMVFIEIDRCAADAIESVTGCRIGKRTLKFKDFGINAATFLRLDTHEAYRIISTESARSQATEFASEQTEKKYRQLEGYQKMPDHLLFEVQRVVVELKAWEMPGPASHYATCSCCGQVVRDGREIVRDKEVLCRPCAGESYYRVLQNITQG